MNVHCIHDHNNPFVQYTMNDLLLIMRSLYLSHRRVANAQASLRVRAVSPEHSLLASTKHRYSGRLLATGAYTRLKSAFAQ